MTAPRTDLIAVVEAAYRLDVSGGAWLTEVARAAGPQLWDGLGGIACFFDGKAPRATEIVSEVTNFGADGRLLDALRAAFETGSGEERDRSLRQGGPVLRLSQLAATPLVDNPFYGPLARSLGFDDVVVLRAINPDGTGAFFAAPVRAGSGTKSGARRGAAWASRWALLSAHLAAGLRLRRSAGAASAILTLGGRVVSLEKGAESAREVLRDAVVAMDRARSRQGRRDERAALEGWRALVDGRWSLVDQFESDGKRHVIAIENAPAAPDPRALLPAERPILHYVAMGHSNKMIAYELGIPPGTAATRVAAIMRKLGVQTRAALVDRYLALMAMNFARVESPSGAAVYGGSAARRVPAAFARLTAAERDVTQLAQAGLSNKTIAARRGCASRTVANLLAAAFAKLGVSSRAELAGAALEGEPPAR